MADFFVGRVAVLGTGVMGVQIAAHLANAEIPVILFGRPDDAGDPRGRARKAIDGLGVPGKSPLVTADRANYIEAASYELDLELLRQCDLIIEAIVEKIEPKEALFRTISPFISPQAIVATNTSGLSVNRLAQCLPEPLRTRFCGVHFFNPLRVMHLVELVAAHATAPELLDTLESWLVSRLGKGVVRTLDTPNFIANRVGFFSMLSVMHHAQQFGLGVDEADALTGPIIGRSKSATYRTADIVGLDTTVHVIQTMRDSLADDPWRAVYAVPAWLSALVTQGALGQKTGAGLYRKDGPAIRVLDFASMNYRDQDARIAEAVQAILKDVDPADRLLQLRACVHPQAQFLWAVFRDLFHYVAYHLSGMADTARDIDLAMRWGFGWSQGPFESWQAAGWARIARAVSDDIEAGKALSSVSFPDWVFERDAVHSTAGSYSAGVNALKPRSALPCYQRQIFPQRVLGETGVAGVTLWENGHVRLWNLPHIEPQIAIVSVKTRNHTLGGDVILGLQEAVTRAEADFSGLVFWHEAPFSYGANLKEMMEAANAAQYDRVDNYIAEFQNTSMRFKYARIPVVAAVQGMALGGGCEFMMHAARRVVALESAIGLVETAAGLIPGGGGCKESAVRAWTLAEGTHGKNPLEFILPVFATIAAATVSRNGVHARELGYVLESDTIVFNADELLYVALREARAMADAGGYPKRQAGRVKVAGRAGIAQCEAILARQQQDGAITAHDQHVARCVAVALCGGEVEAGTLVDEAGLLDVERGLFIELLKSEKTRQRIQHLLDNGKPLRN